METRASLKRKRQELLESSKKEEKEEEDDDDQKAPLFTCEICTENKPSNMRFKNSDRCNHISKFCSECIGKHIEAKMEDKIADIRCPQLDCGELLDPLACKEVLPSAQLFDDWCELLCRLAITGSNRVCQCPYQDCQAVMIDECGDDDIRELECLGCKKALCFKCQLPWKVCEENGEDVNDDLFKQVADTQQWIKCPGCNIYVERITGCNHMTCRCKTEFCYRCGKKILGCKCREPPDQLRRRRIFRQTARLHSARILQNQLSIENITQGSLLNLI